MNGGVEGFVAAPFAEVQHLLADSLEAGRDLGFSFCAYHQGKVVADLWGGHQDVAQQRVWSPNTLLPLTSIAKAVLSTTVWRLVELESLDVDAPVARYWPRFGAHGKDRITLGDVLGHRAGIPAFPDPITLADEIAWSPVVRKIENLRPVWKPGTAHGYHAIVFGFLICELIRRVTGASASTTVRELVIGPLGVDLHMALAAEDRRRLAEVMTPPDDDAPRDLPDAQRAYAAGFTDTTSLLHLATFGSTAMTFDDMNNPDYYTTERPALYGTAHAVARFFASLVGGVDGHRLLRDLTLQRATSERSAGADEVFRVPTRWGTGYMLPGGPLWPDVGRAAFGHIGSTGALAFADREHKFAFAFLPNKMKSVFEIPDRRAQRLVQACHRALGKVGPEHGNGRVRA